MSIALTFSALRFVALLTFLAARLCSLALDLTLDAKLLRLAVSSNSPPPPPLATEEGALRPKWSRGPPGVALVTPLALVSTLTSPLPPPVLTLTLPPIVEAAVPPVTLPLGSAPSYPVPPSSSGFSSPLSGVCMFMALALAASCMMTSLLPCCPAGVLMGVGSGRSV